MSDFKRILPEEITRNPFTAIGKDWMLITAKKADGTFNTMTASWGGVGILWNKPVAFCFIRPQRYTLEFVNASNTLTLSFFDGQERQALSLLGRVSGRDTDKILKSGLEPMEVGDSMAFWQAQRIFLCKKLYHASLEEASFLDPSLLSNYAQKDYHDVFICEICEVYEKQA